MPSPKLPFVKDYTQALYGLVGIGLIFGILSWTNYISPGIRLSKANKSYKKMLVKSSNASQKVAYLSEQLERIEGAKGRLYHRGNLLRSITSFCEQHHLAITGLPAVEKHQNDGYVYLTDKIEVQGRFKDMVQLAYLLEQEQKMGNISSFSFRKTIDRIERKEYLKATIILRNLKSE